MTDPIDIAERLAGLSADHGPDGWPAVQMRDISALCDEVARLRAALAAQVQQWMDEPAAPGAGGVGRAEFVAWLRAYAGGGDHWRGNVLMGEHDIALALWKDMQRQLARVRSEQQALRIAHHCMAPACPGSCSGCNHALSSEQVLQYAKRYAWLRERDLNAVHDGGVFAGLTPLNVVLNGTDLDEAIDAGMLPAA